MLKFLRGRFPDRRIPHALVKGFLCRRCVMELRPCVALPSEASNLVGDDSPALSVGF
jgi:hypothetical protein